MHSKKTIDIFLLCFILMIGIWYFYHGIFAVKHYDMNINVNSITKFPTPANYSTLGGDFAYLWNGAKNFLDPEAGIHTKFKCFLPTNEFKQCFNFTPTPFTAVASSGFSELPFYLSYRVYLMFLLALWVASIYVFSKMQAFTTSHAVLLIAIIFLSQPFQYEFERGNFHSIIFVSVLIAFYCQNWNKDFIAAAFFLTFAMFLKIHPGLFLIYFFIKGYFRTTLYAIFFTVMIFFMSGGFEGYKIYFGILKFFINSMLHVVGLGNHSTNSMLILFGLHSDSELRLLVTNIISIVLILCSLLYIFLMNKKSDAVLLKIELSLILILANIMPVMASRYSLVFVPFLIMTLIEALDHEAIKKKFTKYRLHLTWLLAILTCYLLTSPLALPADLSVGEYNIVANVLNKQVLDIIRQLWFTLFIIFCILIYFHWCIAKEDSNTNNANPFRVWYETDLSIMVKEVRNLKDSFSLKRVAVLTNLAQDYNNKSFLVIRFSVLFLLVYLLYYSIKGSALG